MKFYSLEERQKISFLRNDRGSITMVFCLFALILLGSISYSFYVGQQVEKKIVLQNASDMGALAVANHAAQGLNMIAANNLAIGAAIHVSGSVAVLSSYLSAVYMFTADLGDALADSIKLGIESGALGAVDLGNSFQKDIWNRLAVFTSIYMRTGAGLTKFNDYLADYWLIPASINGIEMVRANNPDGLSVPLQKLKSPLPFYMSYGGLKKTEPRNTICHAINSSKGIVGRDSPIGWLLGPFLSIAGTENEASGVVESMRKFFNFFAEYMPVTLGFMNCGFGLKVPLFRFVNEFLDQILGRAGTGAAIVIAKMNSEKIRETMENVRGDKGKWKVGPVKVWKPWCKASWEFNKNAMGRIYDEIGLFEPSKRSKKILLEKSLEAIKGARNTYTCEEQITGNQKQGFIPIATHGGGHKCLSIDAIDSRCVYKDEVLGAYQLRVCSDIDDQFDRWKQGCAAYDEFAKSGEEDPKNHDGDDFGISVADWGRQGSEFDGSSDGFFGTLNSIDKERRNSLGFLFPDPSENFKLFRDSLVFLNVAANSLKTTAERDPSNCPEGLRIEIEGSRVYCDQSPLVGMARLADLASSSLDKKGTKDFNLAAGGLADLKNSNQSFVKNHANALQGSWSRTQWVMSQSLVFFSEGEEDPKPSDLKMQLFWPAWQTRLTPFDRGFLGETLELLTPKSATGTRKLLTDLKASGI